MVQRTNKRQAPYLSNLTVDSGKTPEASENLILRERVQALERDKRQLEEQLRRLQHVKVISELLTAVSHDLSGALTGILWCAEGLKNRVSGYDADLGAGMAELVLTAEYARRLARKLIPAGVNRQGSFRRSRAQSVAEAAATLLEAIRPRHIKFSASLDAGDAEIWGCPEELQQVIVNLAANSFDAVTREGGRVHLELHRENDHVILRLSDTGHGMSPEVLQRATEPLFTTKSAKGGNGLGLVVVQTILQRHSARLTLNSSEGSGTTAEIAFPLLPPLMSALASGT